MDITRKSDGNNFCVLLSPIVHLCVWGVCIREDICVWVMREDDMICMHWLWCIHMCKNKERR